MISGYVKCLVLRKHLTNLCLLYGLTMLQNDMLSCFECGYFGGQNPKEQILLAIKHLLREIRPYALSLIEAIGLRDEQLMSAIGNSYGDIYEKHLELA